MKSRAVAGVEGWLEQARKVLEDQKDRSLSPSLASVWDSGEIDRDITMGEFVEGVEEVLRALTERPGRWILVAECGPYRYWQALAFEDGSLVVEVISNHWIVEEYRWTREQEGQLEELGWTAPVPPHRLNWSRVESTTSPDVTGVAKQAVETLMRVFGIKEQDRIDVKQFSSENRGRTPATPSYVVESSEEP